ncbi:hypothetical protein [Ferrimonas lipolytica]|uniref:Uncharacterized protein n=1 Tax=Ferrimonas lipolytica TaxID=2724191 RepID=A0A6H1UCK9_9GAMM|nr:hypothetical protein [Ferrimonas lipolytica]QIZ76578.1 hypothetical protein HER31_06680 [Ferrimonas lipolytica]
MRPLDTQFVEFLLTRSEPFLSRYASLTDVGQWRLRVKQQQLPQWQQRQRQNDSSLHNDIEAFITLTFGQSRLPMLRRRYNSYLHRQRKQTKAIDLDLIAVQSLEQIISNYGLNSYSEAIVWMAREINTPLE